jgi:uncharacterized protein with PIN domain
MAIDNQSKLLEKSANSLENTTITPTDLNLIKKDYMDFVFKKREILTILKEQQKELENTKLTHIETFLGTKMTMRMNEYVCPHCTIKSYPSKKALAGHIKKCSRTNDAFGITIEVEPETED